MSGSTTFTIPTAQALNSAAQAIRKQFARKTYNGTSSDAKTLTADEVFFNLDTFQRGQLCADETIISNLGFLFAGAALTWWRSSYKNFSTIEDVRRAMYRRFYPLGCSPSGIRNKISNTKQKSGEALASYVDKMNCLMDQIPNEYPLIERIELIRMGSNDESYQLLIGRAFASMEDFLAFASQASHRPTSNTKSKDRRIHAVERQTEHKSDDESSSDEEEETDVTESFIHAMTQVMNTLRKGQNSRKPGNKFKQKTDKPKEKGQSTVDTKPTREIEGTAQVICPNCDRYGYHGRDCAHPRTRTFCFGCDHPDVYKNECPTCSKQTPKN